MKHLYKTKEGEILEAENMDYVNETVWLADNDHKSSIKYNLSEVQEVVLDKDGKPFMFEGNPVCVGDEINGYKVMDYIVVEDNTKIVIRMITDILISGNCGITSHTPKHPQKKGIEKIEIKAGDIYNGLDLDIALKVNELVEVVNKLKQ